MEWQEEFLRLYSSTDIDDVVKALELKRKFIPRKLYRYRPLSEDNFSYRKREISEGDVFLSHPEKLNDILECWSILKHSIPYAYLDKNAYIDYYLKIGEEQKAKVILENDNWLDALIDSQGDESISSEAQEKIKAAEMESITLAVEEFNKVLRNRIIDMMRIACFSTTATNLPMWYHYADKYKGICLEYSISDVDSICCDRLFPVRYVDRLPDMTYMLAKKDPSCITMPILLSLHKLKDWSYENEWRMIYDRGYWVSNNITLPEEFETKGATINFIKPSKVILGINISSELEKELTDFAQKQGVTAVKSKLTEYGLKID